MNLKQKQSIFHLYGFFFRKDCELNFNVEQLGGNKNPAIALQRLRFILELRNTLELSKEHRKFLEEQFMNELKDFLKNTKDKKLEDKLQNVLNGLMEFGEELGNIIMSLLTGTADKVLGHQEKLLLKKEFDKKWAAHQQLNQLKNTPRLVLK